MLSRRREQAVLLAGLIVLNVALAWDARGLWRDYHQRTRWIYAPVEPGPASSPSARPYGARGAQSFEEIVRRNLFTPERTNQQPQEEAKAPPLPLLWGTMNLGEGWFALMAPGDQASGAAGLSQRVSVGQEIGGYKLVSISGSRVEVDWGGKTFNIDTADSVRRAPRSLASRTEVPAAARANTPVSAGDGSRVTGVGQTPPAATPFAAVQPVKPGAAGNFAPPPGAPADAPPGTVFGGKRKVVTPGPFGDQVIWVEAEPAPKPAGEEKQ